MAVAHAFRWCEWHVISGFIHESYHNIDDDFVHSVGIYCILCVCIHRRSQGWSGGAGAPPGRRKKSSRHFFVEMRQK